MNLAFIQDNHTLGAALRAVAGRHPDREALIFGDQRITYRELLQWVEALAVGFHHLGIGRGDKVAMILPNCPAFVYTSFAAACLGAAAVPLSVQSGSREIEYILNDSEAVAVVTDARAPGTDLLALIEQVRPRLPALKHVIVRDNGPHPNTLTFTSLLQPSTNGATPEFTAEPSDPAMILYTSGTTGVPKGAVHSHRTLMLTLRILISKYIEFSKPSWEMIKTTFEHLKTIRRLPWFIESSLALTGLCQSKLLIVTPFYHISGYIQVVLALLGADKLVVMQRFHPEEALRLIQKERVTLIFGAPPMFQAMLSRPSFNHYDLSSVILSIAGAMPVPPGLVKEIEERIGGFAVILYGATEVAATTFTLPTDSSEQQTETVGRAGLLDGVEVIVVGEDRKPLPPDQAGEVAIRAPTMMEGYYKRPEETAHSIDDEGWYYTGDMGMMDQEGYVKILGRRGDMIIRAGVNIYPAEIEHFLLTHPEIGQVAVVGVPGSAGSGEKVCAYVVRKEGTSLDASQVIGYCWGNIASNKIPDEVLFVDDLPVTPALQKVQHFRLRQKALEEQSARGSERGEENKR